MSKKRTELNEEAKSTNNDLLPEWSCVQPLDGSHPVCGIPLTPLEGAAYVKRLKQAKEQGADEGNDGDVDPDNEQQDDSAESGEDETEESDKP